MRGWCPTTHLSEAHCGFGLEQSAQILLRRSSLLMSSWRVFFATAWSISHGGDGKLELKMSTWDRHHFISSCSDTLLKSTTNLCTPILSYFLSTLWSVALAVSTGSFFTHLLPSLRCTSPQTTPLDS